MMTYGSFVWWPKTGQRQVQKTLSKVQRLALTAVTGCRRSTPSIALEMLLDMPPLHIYIQEEAAKASCRMIEDINPRPGDRRGHLKIYEEFKTLIEMRAVTDSMKVQLEFEQNFDVIIPERREWHDGEITSDKKQIVFYTDGSKKDGRTGAGIFGPGIKAWIPMGEMATVFQAELMAINECARRCLRRRNLGSRTVLIASDSQAALKALRSSVIKSKLVLECRKFLNLLGKRCTLRILWVPGHEGVLGNENADQLAKKGSETSFVGPEPFCGFNCGVFKTELGKWERRCKRKQYELLNIDSHSRHFLEYDKKRAQKALELNRADLRLLTGILTGHCGLKAHMKRVGRSEMSSCRYCDKEEETPIHILCECEALARMRSSSISPGDGFPKPLQIKRTDLHKILNFFKKLDLGEV